MNDHLTTLGVETLSGGYEKMGMQFFSPDDELPPLVETCDADGIPLTVSQS